MTYMGGATSFKLFKKITFPLFFFPSIVTTIVILIPSLIIAGPDNDSVETDGSTLPFPNLKDDNGATSTLITSNNHNSPSKSLKPSTSVIVGVLTATFSLVFLLLLYLKHCNGRNTLTVNPNSQPSQERNNSGIDRTIVESLPIFRFKSLSGKKNDLDCAVCLMRFKDPEVLRLLPKCKHAFHVECLDTWLDAHSTCPLCRYKVDPDDVVNLVDDTMRLKSRTTEGEMDIETGIIRDQNNKASHGGERDARSLEIVLHATNEDVGTTSSESGRKIRQSVKNRLEHRIIVSCGGSQDGFDQRWSDVLPHDELYLASEMIMRKARGGGGSDSSNNDNVGEEMRSVSEMTGMRRREKKEEEERREGVISRWLGWISKAQPQGDVRRNVVGPGG